MYLVVKSILHLYNDVFTKCTGNCTGMETLVNKGKSNLYLSRQPIFSTFRKLLTTIPPFVESQSQLWQRKILNKNVIVWYMSSCIDLSQQ